MKEKLKKAGLVCLIILAVWFYGSPLLIALAGQVFPMPMHQDITQIQSIRLLNSAQREFITLKALEGNEIPSFVEQLLSMKAGRYVNDPPTELGPLTVEIRYDDDAVDYIGSDICQYFDSSGSEKSRGWYYVGRDELAELFRSYVEPQIIDDLYRTYD